MKYKGTEIVFQEIPEEVSLAIAITNCPNHCKGCHSPELWEDAGEELTLDTISEICKTYNDECTCILFMGGDRAPEKINEFAALIKSITNKKVAWYSGKDQLSDKINLFNFDYIKIGSWQEKKGPLWSISTNQKLYSIRNNKLIEIDKYGKERRS